MMTITQETPTGKAVLHLQLDDGQRVLAAQSLSTGLPSEEAVLQWLTHWLPGQALLTAQERVGEELLLQHPQWGLMEARLVESLLRDAVYRTHRKVEISGVIVCRCKKVTRETLRDALAVNPTMSREELTCQTHAGSGCGQCISELQELIEAAQPLKRRWHGEANSHWVLLLQDSLLRWCQHNPSWPPLAIGQFQHGVVRVEVKGELSADQEWELVRQLSDYWSEGFPAPLDVFLDFSIAQS